jgi:hypothetical protein
LDFSCGCGTFYPCCGISSAFSHSRNYQRRNMKNVIYVFFGPSDLLSGFSLDTIWSYLGELCLIVSLYCFTLSFNDFSDFCSCYSASLCRLLLLSTRKMYISYGWLTFWLV